MRSLTTLILLSCVTQLGALDVRKSPAEYPSQIEVADMSVGVEYMVTSFSAEGQTFSVEDHLLLEVGVFPRGEAKVDLRRFTLRINGKRLLMTQTPGMVAASVKYPDWTSKPSLQANVGGVMIGRPQSVERFPGDRRIPETRRSPVDDGSPKPEGIDYAGLINKSALPEGRFNRPLAGFVYFPYEGKLKSIKTVELLIDDSVLKLR
jgi:hypothetical protein